MQILCDLDGVVIGLHPVWLDLYNERYNDTLEESDIHSWDFHRWVRPECNHQIYNFLNTPGLYDLAEPIDGALQGVTRLRELGHRVIFVTSTIASQSGEKIKWLVRNGFVKPDHDYRDYVECRDKSLIRGDIMIDDYGGNLRDFQGYRILVDHPHNHVCEELTIRPTPTFPYYIGIPYERAHGWDEIVKLVEKIEVDVLNDRNKSYRPGTLPN